MKKNCNNSATSLYNLFLPISPILIKRNSSGLWEKLIRKSEWADTALPLLSMLELKTMALWAKKNSKPNGRSSSKKYLKPKKSPSHNNKKIQPDSTTSSSSTPSSVTHMMRKISINWFKILLTSIWISTALSTSCPFWARKENYKNLWTVFLQLKLMSSSSRNTQKS